MSTVPSADELFGLKGEVALITGASSGLGRRFAEVLAAYGAKVVLCARRTERLESLKSEIEAAGGEAACVALDVSDKGAIAQAFDAAEKAFGTVTVTLNNAGIAKPERALEISEADWRAVLDVNLDAVWQVAQEAGRRMAAAGRPGTIINTASILGFAVSANLASYAVAKAGVVQMTRALALELARHDIRVNAIAPGYILTEINRDYFATEAGQAAMKKIPQRRVPDPSALDGTLLLLTSVKASGFMTGSTIVIDGGHLLTGGQ